MKNIFLKVKNRLQALLSPAGEETLIFSEGAAYWLTFKPVIEEMIRRHMKFSYVTLDENDPGLAIKSEFMSSRYAGAGALAFARINFSRAKIMLSTTPNIGCKGFPLARPPRVGKLAHIFHSVSDISFYSKGSLDFYDTVLMPGDFALPAIRQTEKKRRRPAKECLPAGLPYLDTLAAQASPAARRETRPTLLIAPSWGEKGLLSFYGDDFIVKLAEEGFEIIFRPHPQSLKTEKSKIYGLRSKLGGFKNVTFDLEVDGGPSMASADALISDNSSVRFDFAFIYGRPVITLALPDSSMAAYERDDLDFKWEGDLEKELGPVIAPDEKDFFLEKITLYLRRPPASEPGRLAALRNKYIANFGSSSAAIVDWVRAALAEDRP